MSSLQRQFAGYRLTTAEITYRLPDHPGLLQEYIWQDLDLAPEFPELTRFLRFWESELEGPLYAVRVAQAALVGPADLRLAASLSSLH
ncbi:MAG: usg protein [Rhodospirillales bacterium]